MKNSFIRILTIMTLATSISAFALADKASDPKTAKSDTNCETTAASAKTGRSEAQSDDSQKSEKQRLIEQQEKQWLHDVQNIVAG